MMCQTSYIRNVLYEYGMENLKPVDNPLPTSSKSDKFPKFGENESLHRSIVGSVRQIADNSRPDIMYAICELSQKC